ncbi:MAG: hypothetical protein EA377_10545 [Phycisphaerales bacterium]|nr:MAG: hypothetical protein EA377_10545 [Phycisphaerales bacterium]
MAKAAFGTYANDMVQSRFRGLLVCLSLLVFTSWAAGQALVPETVPQHEAVARALEAEWLTDEERAELRVFHGVGDERDLINPTLKAITALNAWRLDDPILDDEDVPVELRAEARLRRGELQAAIDLAAQSDSIRAARIRAEAHEELGQFERAGEVVLEPVRRLQREQLEEADELTEGVRALRVRARVEGQPARDFQTMMGLLARSHQQLDRLYWPARLIEAELLLEKDETQEAAQVLHEVLSFNPRSSEAWYLLGRIALQIFDFNSVIAAEETLRLLNPRHPLADVLVAEMRLIQDDPESSQEHIEAVLNRWPELRRARALDAAMHALMYDDEALQAAIDRYEALSPGSAEVYYVVGRHLSFNRQYDAAAEMLEEAIRRQPNWPAPQIEQGLMELQSGRDAVALRILRDVRELDPFNTRATNSLQLLEDLADYHRLETEHFIVRYSPGIDEIMVEMMPERLEEIHETVTRRFQFEPDRKTVVELMPNHERFAVRITGMPFIHTIAACTGPVIAMEVPRSGSGHTTTYDWPRVFQHEYTHTVTLAQTNNRIPHWLTEAAAVEMEFKPRDYPTAQMLARSLEQGTLFNLDAIKWAFVRPEQPQDRSKAYAQGHWMLEFMNERFGSSAVIRLFERYFKGEREAAAMRNALGVSREDFFREFLEWAEADVQSWGLLAEPSMTSLMDELRAKDPDAAVQLAASQQARLEAIARVLTDQIGQPKTRGRRALKAEDWPELRRPPVEVTDETLEAWLEDYPDHPDLVELKIRRMMQSEGGANASMIPLFERYAELRPVDPMPHQRLAQIYLDSNDPERAIPHLEALDVREDHSPVYAVELARLYREKGDHDRALEKATRALEINPYHAANRERAAAIALQSQRLDLAHQHIRALTKLEPDRPRHAQRLEAVERLMQAEPRE